MNASISDNNDANYSFDRRWIVIVVACLFMAYAPMLYSLYDFLWSQEQYQYFPFVLAAIAWLLFDRGRYASPVESAGRSNWNVAAVSLVLAWALLLLSVLTRSIWFAAVSQNVLAGGVIWLICRHLAIPNPLGIWLLFWVSTPLPAVDNEFVTRLQTMSSQASSSVLDLLGIDHLMSGNVLQLPSKQLFVDEACSGIVSVRSVVAAAAIFSVWKNRTMLHTALLLSISIGWAAAMNVLRITSIAVAEWGWGLNLASGWQHDMLGLLLFSLTFIATLSSDQLLLFLLDDIELRDDEGQRNHLVRLWNRFFQKNLVDDYSASESTGESPTTTWSSVMAALSQHKSLLLGILTAFGALALLQATFWLDLRIGTAKTIEPGLALVQQDLPAELDSWLLTDFEQVQRDTFDEDYGEYSRIYNYEQQGTGLKGTLSVDFPFNGWWHLLSRCYGASGSKLISRTQIDDIDWPYVVVDFESTPGQYGHLVYTLIGVDGKEATPPPAWMYGSMWTRLWEQGPRTLAPKQYQIQFYVASTQELSDDQKTEALACFLTSREILREKLIETKSTPNNAE